MADGPRAVARDRHRDESAAAYVRYALHRAVGPNLNMALITSRLAAHEIPKKGEPRPTGMKFVGTSASQLSCYLRTLDQRITGQFLVVAEHLFPGLVRQVLDALPADGGASRLWTAEETLEQARLSVENCDECIRQRAWLPKRYRIAVAVADGDRGALYIAVGTSGSGVDGVLARAVDAPGRAREVVSLERELTQALATFARSVPGRTNLGVMDAVRLPDPALKAVWQRAAHATLTKTREHLDAGSDVFLKLHAVYRDIPSWNSRMYVSAVDVMYLREVVERSRPARVQVLAFIDDCFDGALRVMGEQGMYSGERVEDVLLDLVQWRGHEVIASRYVADALGAERLIVPTKSSAASFESILGAPVSEVVYLSHDVTAPYRWDVAERAAHITFVTDVAAGLRARGVPLVETTGVDDYRVELDADGQPRDKLRARWPVPPDALSPQEESARRRSLERGWARRHPHDVRRLQTALLNSVHARGRAFTAQAGGGVIQIRPFARPSGESSEGMRIVAAANGTLVAAHVEDIPRRRTVIYHPPQDERRRRARQITDAFLAAGSLAEWGLDPSIDGEALVRALAGLDNLVEVVSSLKAVTAGAAMSGGLLGLLDRAGLPVGPVRESDRGVHRTLRDRFARRARAALFVRPSDETSRAAFAGATWIERELTAEALVDWLSDHWFPHRAGAGVMETPPGSPSASAADFS